MAIFWIIAIAILVSVGRQFYMNVGHAEKKLTFSIRIFIIEAIVTTITLTILFYIAKWTINLF
jgi:hypothetical protein